MNSRARLLLLSRVTGQVVAAADAGAFGTPTSALFHSSALFHDTACLHLTRLSSTLAVSPPVSNEGGHLSRASFHDAAEQWQQLLLGIDVPAANFSASRCPWPLHQGSAPSPQYSDCRRRSFASQAGTDSRGTGKPANHRQTDAAPIVIEHSARGEPEHGSSGWTRGEVWNIPNAISMARLVSGPVIAHWIVAGRMDAALLGLAISGWSDWLDGFVARRFDQQSTLGSYLDPLADKVLICSVVAALGVQGTLPGYLTVAILGRDVFLIVASFTARARSLNWRRVSIAEFFRIVPKDQQGPSIAASGVQGAGAVTPLYISKVNTVFQLATVAGFLLHAHSSWPPLPMLDVAAAVTTGTTVLSGAAYVQAFRRGHI